jgi:hypothetical protein
VTGNAMDFAGNAATSMTVGPFNVDMTKPTVSDDHVTTYTANATITISASDLGSGVKSIKWDLDSTTPTVSATDSVAVHTSVLGTHTLEYSVEDVAGNITATSTVHFAVIAPVIPAPVTTISTNPTNTAGWLKSDVGFSLTATENPSVPGTITSYYMVNSSALTTYSVPATVTTEGTSAIKYYSVDATGNTEATKTLMVKIDKTAPLTTDDHAASYTLAGTIHLTPTDPTPTGVNAVSGVATTTWTLNGVAGSGLTIPVSGVGIYTLAYHSVDVAGNVEGTTTVTFNVLPAQTTVQAYISISGPSFVKVHKTYTIHGHVSPNAPGRVYFTWYRASGSKWKLYGRGAATLVGGSFTTSIKPNKKGHWRMYTSYSQWNTPTVIYKKAATRTKNFTVK